MQWFVKKLVLKEVSMEDSRLVFYYSHESCPARAAALPVIAWLCRERKIDFDGYFSVRPSLAGIGDYLPFAGNRHEEQLYFLTNFYEKVLYISMSEGEQVPFERFFNARGFPAIRHRSSELVELYSELFERFGEIFPNDAVVYPSRDIDFPLEAVDLGSFKIPGRSRIDTFFYPEIFYRKALGIHLEAHDRQFEKLRELGVKKLYLACCGESATERFERLGFEVETIEELNDGETLLSLTDRIARRWIDKGKGIALGNDPITLRWTAKYLREDILPVAALKSLPDSVPVIAELAGKTGNNVVWGSQVYDDVVISELSKKGIVLVLAHDVEIGMTIRDKVKLPSLWLKEAKAPWKDEVSDDYLKQKIKDGCLPISFVNYAADLGHLPVLPRYLDLHSMEGIKDGIAFPSNWWEFAGETLEQFFIPRDMGGIFPSGEILLSSAGLGVATEAKSYLPRETYRDSLLKARKSIAMHCGEGNVPVGHYSFQDACPGYRHGSAEPDYTVLEEVGFEYAISYKEEGKWPQVLYDNGRLIVLNQQTEHWSFDPMNDVKKWEKRFSGVYSGVWAIIGLDSPFWGMTPCYFGEASKGLDLTILERTMKYVISGGETGRLFLLKPHELVRYVRLLRKDTRTECNE